MKALTTEVILAHIEQLKLKTTDSCGLFTLRTANQWIDESKKRPKPQMLFGEFWFEGELCILFSDTNLGKSILAVQVGNSISKGVPMDGFRLESKKQAVLYCDFELSDKQFEIRYHSDESGHYQFDDSFYRLEINPDASMPQDMKYEDFLYQSIEKAIIKSQASVVIVDNLTYLKSGTESASDALPLMKTLNGLTSKHQLSLPVLAHTPKRDLSKPITRNDLQGSKMLINFCDSAFAIGENHKDRSQRYLKQIKSRNTELVYDTDNVVLCQIAKEKSFLGFSFFGYGIERENLKEITQKDAESRLIEVLELKKQGVSNTAIAKQFGVSEGAVRKWIKKSEQS